MNEDRSMSVHVAVAAVFCGLFGAFALVGGEPGIGFPLTGLAAAGAVGMADLASVRSRDTLMFGGLAFALICTVALRDAEWLVAVVLLAALGLGACAVAGISTWISILHGGLTWLTNSILGPGRVAVVLGNTVGPSQRERVVPVLRGSAAGLFLLVVFGTLFVSADSAFARITSDLLSPDWDPSLIPARVITGLVACGVTAGLVVTLARRGRLENDPFAESPLGPEAPERKPRDRAEWIVPLVLLDVLFIAFVFVQITVLFAGRAHVLDSADIGYADYARSGFFQLLAVAFLTLAVIAFAVRRAQAVEDNDRRWLQVLLGILCVCTLVILASAFQRLRLYEDMYGFTRLRVSVHATILWLGALFTLVIAAGVRMKGTWLPRAVVALSGAGLLAFTLVNPDALIAERNVARYEDSGKIDLLYLSTLSADAIPGLAQLPHEQFACLAPELEREVSWHEPLMSTNLSRARGRDILQEKGAQPEDCAP